MKSNRIKIFHHIRLMQSGFIQEFCIDLDNDKIVPHNIPKHFNRGKDPWEGKDIYYLMLDDIFDYNNYLHDKFCDNAIKKEYNLSNEDCKKLINFFNNEKVFDQISANGYNSNNIYAKFDDEYHNIHPAYWRDLNNILKEITNLDVLNLENIISQSDYDFKKDGINYKDTLEKLNLKTLCFYNRGASWLDSSPEFAIDFDKNRIRGCINKELSQENIKLILNLLKKYNIYKWTLKNQWKKTIDTPMSPRFDGTVWELELIFEDDKIFNIGGGNAYPDTYVHLGEEILEIFDLDICRLKYIHQDPEEYKLFKIYGDKQLNQK